MTRHPAQVRSPAAVLQVTRAALTLSGKINDRRKARGLQSRPVRAAVIGFPNVGKSALINRFLSRRVCESAPKPGVTKQLRWLRVGGDLDLLDAPGNICVQCTMHLVSRTVLQPCQSRGFARHPGMTPQS